MLGKLKYGEVLVYFDDLLIPYAGEEEELVMLETVFSFIDYTNVEDMIEKCVFLQSTLKYL